MEKVTITLIRSPIGYKKQIRDTVRALGFKKMHQTLTKEKSPAIMGMISKIGFMLKVE